MTYLERRGAMLRRSPVSRALARETTPSPDKLIYPLFVRNGSTVTLDKMPGICVFSVSEVCKEVERALEWGVSSFIVFGCEEEKDPEGLTALSKESAACRGIREIKKRFKDDVYLIADVCLCGYTTHGHCGVLFGGHIDHEKTAEMLGRVAVHYGEAGADMVAPSAMTDHQVRAIRSALDKNNMSYVAIMSYSCKYASRMYGPFRDAVHSAPSHGDRTTYQMDPPNKKEALAEALQDIAEGADMVMVKPALFYLDVVHYVAEHVHVPVACYNVSGEYALIKKGIEAGIIDERVILEIILAMFRAGASAILTYHAVEVARILRDK